MAAQANDRFYWQRIPGSLRLYGIEADILHCRGFLIVPDVEDGKIVKWRLFSRTCFDTKVYERYSDDLRALKDEARRMWNHEQEKKTG